MTDTAIEEQPHDVTAPVEDIPSTGVSAPADDLDTLLPEYDAKTAPAESESETSTDGGEPQNEPFDRQALEDLFGPSPRVAELEGELTSVRQQELDRQSRSDFEGFAKKLQADLDNPNIPEDFARTT